MVALVATVPLALADYVVIVADLNAPKGEDAKGGTGGGPGPMGGSEGPMGMGPTGMGPGGGRPGMGMPGMGRPGMGMPGMGMPGGMGSMGGLFGGFFGGASSDADDAPFLVVTVLEVDSIGTVPHKLFDLGRPVPFRHHLIPGGGTVRLANKISMAEVMLIRDGNGKPLPTVAKAFQHEHDLIFKDKEKVSAEAVLKLARWALEHGLVSRCAEMLDKAVELDKANSVAVAWTKIKADLARPLSKEDVASALKTKLLEGYKATPPTDKHHYVLLHDAEGLTDPAAHLDRLENSFRAYYYWWVLNGVALPVPTHPLVAVVAEKEDDFKRLQKHLNASPVLTDSFFARREGLAVYAAKRNDQPYQTLKVMAAPYWQKDFNPQGLLTGKLKAGLPKGIRDLSEADEPRLMAVLLRAMELEWEATAVSHETARQLLFASGLLPANVAVPEWLQFGLGSFFESPLQSPWGGTGAPSGYWLPRYKELRKDNKLGKTPYESLVKVVTDGYFRHIELGEPKDVTVRKGRAASWALAYFLAQKELDGLRRYFQELGKMPRDLELDEQVLLAAFARAFDCVDANRKVDVAKLTNLANRWDAFVRFQPLEAESIHQKIREAFARMNKAASTNTSTGTNPALPGSMPGGVRPGFPGGSPNLPSTGFPPGSGRPGMPGTGRPGSGRPGGAGSSR